MVVTRRGALAKAQNSPPPVKAGRKDLRSRKLSASKLDIGGSTSAKVIKRARRKQQVSSDNAAAESSKVASEEALQPNAEGVPEPKPKASLFGFKYDQISAASVMPPFNPAICYQFVSSCPAPEPEPQDGHIPLSATQFPNAPPAPIPSPRSKDDEEFEKMKTAIMCATRVLVSRLLCPPLFEESRAISQGVMLDPEMRARVPEDLLEEYDAAMAMEDQGQGMELIEHLVASTGRATWIVKLMVDNHSDCEAYDRAAREAELGEPQVDPAFDAMLRTALTSCNLAMVDGSAVQPTASAQAPASNGGPSSAHHTQRPMPFRPTGADDAMNDEMAGFEVESVAPTIISAPAAGPSQPFVHSVTPHTPTPATAQAFATIPELSNPRDALMQTSGMDISRILDPTSKEYRCVRKARAMLAAIRMTAGTEEAEEVYTGMQLMVFYDMIGILSTDIFTTTYRRQLDRPAAVARPALIAGPSQAALGHRHPSQIALNASSQTGGAFLPQSGSLVFPSQAGLPSGLAAYAGPAAPPPIDFSTPAQNIQPSLKAGRMHGIPKAAHRPGPVFPGFPQPTGTGFVGGPQPSTSAFAFPSGFFNTTTK